LSAKIERLVICGDSVNEHEKSDIVNRGSYRTQTENKIVYDALNDNYDRFEAWLGQFIDVLDVDIMPGKEDFSSAYFP